jgi:hypothetical protein
MIVVMALVTTLATAPVLQVLMPALAPAYGCCQSTLVQLTLPVLVHFHAVADMRGSVSCLLWL